MGSAAERKHQLAKLRSEMAAALKKASDRRARRAIEEEYLKKMDEVSCDTNQDATLSGDSEESTDSGGQARARGPSRQARRAENKQKQLMREIEGKLERHAISDRSEAEDQQMKTIIPEEYVMVDMPADGSCLFHAINHQLKQNYNQTKTVWELREILANWIEQHEDEYAAYLPDTTVEKYCHNLKCTHQYGGEVEIKAASEAFELAINVHTANGTIKYDSGSDKSPLHLVFLKHKYGSRKSNHSVVTGDNS